MPLTILMYGDCTSCNGRIRMLDYRGVGLVRFHSTHYTRHTWSHFRVAWRISAILSISSGVSTGGLVLEVLESVLV